MIVDIHAPIDDLFYDLPMFIERSSDIGVYNLYNAHQGTPTEQLKYVHLNDELSRYLDWDTTEQDRIIRLGDTGVTSNIRRGDQTTTNRYLEKLTVLSCQPIYNNETELFEAYDRPPSKEEISAVMGPRAGFTGSLKMLAKHFWSGPSNIKGSFEKIATLIGVPEADQLKVLVTSEYGRALLATVRIRVEIRGDSVCISGISTHPSDDVNEI